MESQPSWQELLSRNVSLEPSKIYCIAFTPRSGSTWFGHVLERTRALGSPKEWFNPTAAAYTIRTSGAKDFLQYYTYLKHHRKVNDVFGAEVAYLHFNKLLKEGHGAIFDEVDAWYFLRRRDFVAQAVSLYRASESGVYHIRGQKTAPAIDPGYNAEKIRKAVLSIMNQEFRFNQYFGDTGVTPHALWYEELHSTPADRVISEFASSLGVAIDPESENIRKAGETDFQITAGESSKTLIERFKTENRELVAFWHENRGECSVSQFANQHPRPR